MIKFIRDEMGGTVSFDDVDISLTRSPGGYYYIGSIQDISAPYELAREIFEADSNHPLNIFIDELQE